MIGKDEIKYKKITPTNEKKEWVPVKDEKEKEKEGGWPPVEGIKIMDDGGMFSKKLLGFMIGVNAEDIISVDLDIPKQRIKAHMSGVGGDVLLTLDFYRRDEPECTMTIPSLKTPSQVICAISQLKEILKKNI